MKLLLPLLALALLLTFACKKTDDTETIKMNQIAHTWVPSRQELYDTVSPFALIYSQDITSISTLYKYGKDKSVIYITRSNNKDSVMDILSFYFFNNYKSIDINKQNMYHTDFDIELDDNSMTLITNKNGHIYGKWFYKHYN